MAVIPPWPPWLLAALAGALAAAADVASSAAHVSHAAASGVAGLLFYAAGRRGRDLRAAAAGALLHGLLDGVWIVHVQALHAGLPYAAMAAAFDLAIDLLAAHLGARSAARFL
jgi:hypothetical protein